jgi:hypothetical protein
MWLMELSTWLMEFLIGTIPSTLCSLLGVFHKDD